MPAIFEIHIRAFVDDDPREMGKARRVWINMDDGSYDVVQGSAGLTVIKSNEQLSPEELEFLKALPELTLDIQLQMSNDSESKVLPFFWNLTPAQQTVVAFSHHLKGVAHLGMVIDDEDLRNESKAQTTNVYSNQWMQKAYDELGTLSTTFGDINTTVIHTSLEVPN